MTVGERATEALSAFAKGRLPIIFPLELRDLSFAVIGMEVPR